jgi:hypothetical protein
VKVGEVMTRGVELASPDDTIQKAASRMAELDTGVLPVGEGDRLVGMLTDRDIAVRAVAQGKGPGHQGARGDDPDVRYCFEDDDLDDAVRSMGEQKVRRLPVLGRDKRLVGHRRLGDVALYADSGQTDAACERRLRAGGPHTQAAEVRRPALHPRRGRRARPRDVARYCPTLLDYGAATWGATREEALGHIREVVAMVVERMGEEGVPVPGHPADHGPASSERIVVAVDEPGPRGDASRLSRVAQRGDGRGGGRDRAAPAPRSVRLSAAR